MALAAPQRLTPWFAVTGLLLLVTLLAAAFVQIRQHSLLNATVQYQDDYLILSLYQLETEYLRLREQLQRPGPADPQAVQLRYDVFVSRVGLLNSERAERLLAGTPVAENVMKALTGFIRGADRYLGSGVAAPLPPQAIGALVEGLLPLADPIHQLMLEASHQVERQVSDRQSQVRQHNLIGLWLTVFLSLMVLVFALIAMLQLRRLGERHRRLELLADQLREARVEADAANRAKSEFLADMSHELRTPLHGLIGMLTLLKESPRHLQVASWLRTADDSAAHLLRLLDDILDLSKLESGALQLQPQAVHLSGLLRETQALMQPAAAAKGLELHTELDPALPAMVLLDPTRVRQVLFNLMGNAVKFSEAGAVLLRCRVLADGEDERLVFDVADTGIGIAPQQLPLLYERWQRLDQDRAQRFAGTGLGLAISRNLAQLMAGEIVVHSALGVGSVFSFRCPLKRVSDERTVPLLPPAEAAGARALNVLVADDHPVNRLVMQALLERLGHSARLVENGLEALHALGEQPFDLVLMDVHMPIMDGVAATAAIRALPAPANKALIIGLTADVMSETRQRCLDAGAEEVLTKPLLLPELQALLERYFGAEAPRALPSARAPGAAPSGGVGATELLDQSMIDGVGKVMGRTRLPALYADFFIQAQDAAQRMRAALHGADFDTFKRDAHTVKGAALNLGLPALADAASALQRGAGERAEATLQQALAHYEALIDATHARCRSEGLLA